MIGRVPGMAGRVSVGLDFAVFLRREGIALPASSRSKSHETAGSSLKCPCTTICSAPRGAPGAAKKMLSSTSVGRPPAENVQVRPFGRSTRTDSPSAERVARTEGCRWNLRA